MAFTEVQDLGCDTTISLGGRDKKTGKPNPTSVTGYYLGSREFDSKFGRAKIHVLQTPKGTVGVYGKTDLDRKMGAVEAGYMIRITQNGTVPTNKGNDMLKFKVEVDQEQRIDVGLVAGAAEADDDTTSSTTYDDTNAGFEYGADQPEQDVDQTPVNRAPARTPDAASRAKVQALLNGRNK